MKYKPLKISINDTIDRWKVIEKTTKITKKLSPIFLVSCIHCNTTKKLSEVTLLESKSKCKTCETNAKPLTQMTTEELQQWQQDRDKFAAVQDNSFGRDNSNDNDKRSRKLKHLTNKRNNILF